MLSLAEKGEYSWDGDYGLSIQNGYNLMTQPFYIFHGGLIDIQRSTMTLANDHGNLRSSLVAPDIENAYNLNVNQSGPIVKPTYCSTRNAGYSPRLLPPRDAIIVLPVRYPRGGIMASPFPPLRRS